MRGTVDDRIVDSNLRLKFSFLPVAYDERANGAELSRQDVNPRIGTSLSALLSNVSLLAWRSLTTK
jgi:hypothetical protein